MVEGTIWHQSRSGAINVSYEGSSVSGLVSLWERSGVRGCRACELRATHLGSLENMGSLVHEQWLVLVHPQLVA